MITPSYQYVEQDLYSPLLQLKVCLTEMGLFLQFSSLCFFFYDCTDRLWLKNLTGANACKLAVARIPVYIALVAFYMNASLLICMVTGI